MLSAKPMPAEPEMHSCACFSCGKCRAMLRSIEAAFSVIWE